ncbi:MAG: hypothetical protein R3A52_14640 [Polyangiales bacterium]
MTEKRALRPSVVEIVDAVSQLTLEEAAELSRALADALDLPHPSDPYEYRGNPPWVFEGTNPPWAMGAEVKVGLLGAERRAALIVLREAFGFSLGELVAFEKTLPAYGPRMFSQEEAQRIVRELTRLGVEASMRFAVEE